MGLYKEIKDFAKEYGRQVIAPAYVGSVLFIGMLGLTHAVIRHQVPWLTHRDHYDYSAHLIDENGDGKLKTRVMAIPRVGIVKERITEE